VRASQQSTLQARTNAILEAENNRSIPSSRFQRMLVRREATNHSEERTGGLILRLNGRDAVTQQPASQPTHEAETNQQRVQEIRRAIVLLSSTSATTTASTSAREGIQLPRAALKRRSAYGRRGSAPAGAH